MTAARRLTTILACLIAAVLTLGTVPSHADPRAGQQLSVVVLGDSYSAGNGAGSYYGPQGSFRSRANWGHRYVDWLNGQGVHANLTVLAWSGNTIDDVIRNQIPQVPRQADLVMLTIGGNDAGFASILSECFVVGMRDATDCRDAVDRARTFVRGDLKDRMLRLLRALDERLTGDHARIVLIGYPHLSLDRPGYVLSECLRRSWGRCKERLNYPAATEVRSVGAEAAQAQAATVAEWNAGSRQRVSYIDSVQSAFAGHEPDPSSGSRNDYRWLNEFLETEGRLGESGRTESRFSWEYQEWYHPNLIGHDQLAAQLRNRIGVPDSTRPVTLGHVATLDDDAHPAAAEQPFAWIQGPYVLATGESVTLDGRASFTPSGTLDRFEWDLDGDGVFEVEGGPTLDHAWQDEFVGEVALRVTDSQGRTAVGTAEVDVSSDGDGIPAAEDNCPDAANHGQEDHDSDGVGDVCDTDPGIPTTDKEGITEAVEDVPSPVPSPTPTPGTPAPAPSATAPGKAPEPQPSEPTRRSRPGLPATGS